MKTLGLILMCSDCFGTENGWHGHWHFPIFLFVFLLMCFMFLGWRRRNYSGRWSGWCGCGDYERGNSKEILKNRYAKGEISKEEFDSMMDELSKDSNSGR